MQDRQMCNHFPIFKNGIGIPRMNRTRMLKFDSRSARIIKLIWDTFTISVEDQDAREFAFVGAVAGLRNNSENTISGIVSAIEKALKITDDIADKFWVYGCFA